MIIRENTLFWSGRLRFAALGGGEPQATLDENDGIFTSVHKK